MAQTIKGVDVPTDPLPRPAEHDCTVDVPMGPLMQRLTIHARFTGVGRLRFRLWVASLLFKLGALIAGCRIEIDTDGPKAETQA